MFCRDNDGNVVNTNSIVSGIVTSLEIPVLVRNNGEDAFGARIAFTFNSVLVFSRAAPANEVIYLIVFKVVVLFVSFSCSEQLL